MLKYLINIILLGSLFSLVGCATTPTTFELPEADTKAMLQVRLHDTGKSQQLLDRQVAEVYRLNQYKLIWFQSGTAKPALTNYFTQFFSLQDEGIDVTKLQLSQIRAIDNLVDKIYKQEVKLAIDSIIQMDRLLTKSYLAAAYQLSCGNEFEMNDGACFDAKTLSDNANNLVFAMNNANIFPSFEIYRPNNDMYAALLLTIKSWMLLGKDTAYLNNKQAIANDDYNESQLVYILRKELNVDSATESPSLYALIKDFQAIHDLPKTGVLNEATKAKLMIKPDEYRRKIKVNMERLRQFPNYQFAFVSLNVLNNRFVLYVNGQILFYDHLNETFNSDLYQARLVSLNEANLPNVKSKDPLSKHYFATISENGILKVWSKTNDGFQVLETITIKDKTEFKQVYDAIGMAKLINNGTQQDATSTGHYFIKTYLSVVADPKTKKIVYMNDKQGLDASVNIF